MAVRSSITFHYSSFICLIFHRAALHAVILVVDQVQMDGMHGIKQTVGLGVLVIKPVFVSPSAKSKDFAAVSYTTGLKVYHRSVSSDASALSSLASSSEQMMSS